MIRQIAVLTLVIGGYARAIDAWEFEAPVMMKAGDKAVRVESPGYAPRAGPILIATGRKICW